MRRPLSNEKCEADGRIRDHRGMIVTLATGRVEGLEQMRAFTQTATARAADDDAWDESVTLTASEYENCEGVGLSATVTANGGRR